MSWARRVAAASVLAIGLLLAGAQAASAHVVPWTTVQLDVEDGRTLATVAIPLDDIEAATGLDLGDQTQADIDAQAAQLTAYLRRHVAPTSDDGRTWAVTLGALKVIQAGAVTTTRALPAAGHDGHLDPAHRR